MRKLSKNQQYAIMWLLSQNQDINHISEELNISLERVQSIVRQFSDPQQAKKQTESQTQKLMIRETSVKKNNSVAVMTKEASEYNDDRKKATSQGNKEHQDKDCIFRPNS